MITDQYIKNINKFIDAVIEAKLDLYNQLKIGYNEELEIPYEMDNTETLEDVYNVTASLLPLSDVLTYIKYNLDLIVDIIQTSNIDFLDYFKRLEKIRETDPLFIPNYSFFFKSVRDKHV